MHGTSFISHNSLNHVATTSSSLQENDADTVDLYSDYICCGNDTCCCSGIDGGGSSNSNCSVSVLKNTVQVWLWLKLSCK